MCQCTYLATHIVSSTTTTTTTLLLLSPGFVLCKKVPGSMHFLAKAPGHSFDHMSMNMSHIVHHLYFGTKPTQRRQRALEALHPLGLTDDWADKLRGSIYMSSSGRATFEHYMQVCGVCVVGG